jgi:hypothetical protein
MDAEKSVRVRQWLHVLILHCTHTALHSYCTVRVRQWLYVLIVSAHTILVYRDVVY